MLTWRETNKERCGAQKVSSCGRYHIVVTWDFGAGMENMMALYSGKDSPGAIGGGIQRYAIDDRMRKEKAAQYFRTACEQHAVTRPWTPGTSSPESATTGRFHQS